MNDTADALVIQASGVLRRGYSPQLWRLDQRPEQCGWPQARAVGERGIRGLSSFQGQLRLAARRGRLVADFSEERCPASSTPSGRPSKRAGRPPSARSRCARLWDMGRS
jgi:hypothetical protein